ncbi:hypothetical protein J2S25_001011 [Mesobacillus stamsii]|uniref:Coenzyme PQQ synthesis protein A n=1 Tax=Mesobacillus stamsii TaxID=225347 RepID=A0ABU0FSE1_9BACI|nr:hypothetical protein [Mesobacillus stamsii]
MTKQEKPLSVDNVFTFEVETVKYNMESHS